MLALVLVRVLVLDVPQHVRHNEESHMASPNVDLIKMRDATIAGSNGDVLQLDVHVVFGYRRKMLAEIQGACEPNCDRQLRFVPSLNPISNLASETSWFTHLPTASPGRQLPM